MRVLINHTSNVASVTWNLLATDHMSGPRDPVAGMLATVTEDIFIYFRLGWLNGLALHTLNQG